MSRISITPGTRDDLLALADHHYNNAEPATIAAVLRAHWYDTLAGVLVVSYPTLNADWRSAAFGPAFKLNCKGDLARRTNKRGWWNPMGKPRKLRRSRPSNAGKS